MSIWEHKPRKRVHLDHESALIPTTKACPFRTPKRLHSDHESVSIQNTKACPVGTQKRVHSEHESVSIRNKSVSIRRKNQSLLLPAPTAKLGPDFTFVVTDPEILQSPFTTCWTTFTGSDGESLLPRLYLVGPYTSVPRWCRWCIKQCACRTKYSCMSQQCCDWWKDPLSQMEQLGGIRNPSLLSVKNNSV